MEDITPFIHYLPSEVIEIIFQFLTHEELDACFKVCQRWRCILNEDKIWKKFCIYPEKYLKKNNKFLLRSEPSTECIFEPCKWRKYYIKEQLLSQNWRKGKYTIENSNIEAVLLAHHFIFVDDHGNHWLFSISSVLKIWNITETAVLHHESRNDVYNDIRPVKDKLVSISANCVSVFQFMNPDYRFELKYRFISDNNAILPSDGIISYGYNSSCDTYIIVDNFFVGYSEDITNLHTAFLHIWDLDSATKIATQSTFQQSFVDFVRLSSGRDITSDMAGELNLYQGNSGMLMVALKDYTSASCQISLFSLHTITFVRVIAQLHSYNLWCMLKNELVVIWNSDKQGSPRLSVYNASGEVLVELDTANHFNPYSRKELWFTGSKLIVKLNENIHTFTFVNSEEVDETILRADENDYILCYFEPNFLVMHKKHTAVENLSTPSFPVSVWDIVLGVKLWEVKSVEQCYGFSYEDVHYPGKLLVKLVGSNKISIFNFDKED